MDYTEIVDDFVNDERVLEFCSAAETIVTAMMTRYPQYCSQPVLDALLFYAGQRSLDNDSATPMMNCC